MSFVKKLVRKYLFLSGEVISYDLSILSIPLRHHRFENFSLIIAILHPPKKKNNNKNERRIKLENHRSSFVAIQANPSLFDEKSTIDNPRAKLWPRLFIIAQPSFVAGATPRPRSPSVPSWKSGGEVLERRKILGGQAFRPRPPEIEVALPWPGVAERIENPRNRSRRRGSGRLKRKRQSSDFIPGHQSSSSSLFHPN